MGIQLKLIFLFSVFIKLSLTEWIATHSGLPPYSKIRPDKFLLNLTWQGETGSSKPRSISLSLKRSEAVGSRIPIYKNDMNGKPYQSSLSNLKHSTFYHDLQSQTSISLTSFAGEGFTLKGSFPLDDDTFDIEPYHPKIHKRSVSAEKGDHIVTKRDLAELEEVTDYVLPKIGTPDYERLQNVYKLVDKMEEKGIHVGNGDRTENKKENHWLEKLGDSLGGKRGKREKRQTLPDTTYIVQLYMIVDFYLYETLSASKTELGWPGDVLDYIHFVMGHMASEIDVRYRNINSSVSPVSGSWTVGTKLSYLLIAEDGVSSPWTYPSVDGTLDSATGLTKLDTWQITNSGSLPPDADHFMLVTSLDLTSGGASSNAGLANVAGACGSHPTSINEFGQSTILAHELGHNLAAAHDGTGNNCSSDDLFVMSASSGITDNVTVGNPWLFSSCSVQYFDGYFTTLNNDGNDCLLNEGTYIASWADDYAEYIGQSIPVDEQCRLAHGDGHVYSPSKFSEICQTLWCTADGSNLSARGASMSYTTCGDGKWCVEEVCVSDPAAPALDETCPFGDSGSCGSVTSLHCAAQPSVVASCCGTCATFAKPWLGPDCPYGDRLSDCTTLNDASCALNPIRCCDSCCSVNGAAVGYSCEQPITTTTPTTTTTIPATTTTTPATTTTTKPPTTTATKPPTTTTTKPATATTTKPPTTTTTKPPTTTTTIQAAATTTKQPTATTTKPPTTTTTIQAIVTTTKPPTATTTKPPTTTTTIQATTTTMSPTTTATPTTTTTQSTSPPSQASNNYRFKSFVAQITITNFTAHRFDCTDPDLQAHSSETFIKFKGILCSTVEEYVNNVRNCDVDGIECGSIVTNTTIVVVERDTDDPAKAAPANAEEFTQQIAPIVNDAEINVSGVPAIRDVDECGDVDLNDCSPNANCTNTDGYYNCTCSDAFPVDISEFDNEPGRICAKSCEGFICGADEVCQTQAEAAASCVPKSVLTTSPPTTLQPSLGSRYRLFELTLRIDKFFSYTFDCTNPDLQDQRTLRYVEFKDVVCTAIRRHVRKVDSCDDLTVSCGSIMVTTILKLLEEDSDSPAVAAAVTAAALVQQIAEILRDSELVIFENPIVRDVDECADVDLNDCSPNANCRNTDGYYTCTCSDEYSSDMSEYSDVEGRTCAQTCEGYFCPANQVCQERAEDEPTCQCEGCNYWIFAIGGVGFLVVVVVLILVIWVCCAKRKNSKHQSRRGSLYGADNLAMYENNPVYMDGYISGRRTTERRPKLSDMERTTLR